MGTGAFTIRSDSTKFKQLHKLASQMDRSRNSLVNQLEEFPKMGRPGRVRGTLEPVVPGLPCIVPYRIKGGVL